MGYDLDIFDDKNLRPEYIDWLASHKSPSIHSHFAKLWDYYTNPMIDIDSIPATRKKVNPSGRCYLQAQEFGLPPRITGLLHSADWGVFAAQQINDIQRKEVVIENDIAWRINAAADFLFGKPITFVSKSPDSQKRPEIESILKAVFSANGNIGFLQDLAVLGSVYGFVDCLLRTGDEILERGILSRNQSFDGEPLRTVEPYINNSTASQKPSSTSQNLSLENVLQLAQTIEMELIEAPRALPVLDENDYKKIRYYVQHFHLKRNALSSKDSFLSRLLSGFPRSAALRRGTGPFDRLRAGDDARAVLAVTEITSATAWQRYEDKQLVAEGEIPWGFLPVVHVQNIAQPYYYEGLSDVESLIPLQDELNTRLSDRASRITFQSFKMYLGKGIEGFEDRPVSPGRMWYTDNLDATIEEFGGDAATPSEDIHIAEIREAMDKASGVTPLVAGVLKSKLGNLTSAVALKLTLMGMLSKTERKRFTYGEGLKKICRMVLDILDKASVYKTGYADKEVDIIFPSPLPENVMEKLKEAQIKKELGIPTEQVLRELGYENMMES
jgi:hypothetical protein